MLQSFNKNCAIKSNDIMGRYVVAINDIQPGEIVLMESPVVISSQWHSYPRCTNCFKDSLTVCKKCNIFPLCLRCLTHNEFDCDFVQVHNFPKNFLIDNFIVFGPLKFLLVMENNCNLTEQKYDLMAMESHQEKRRNCEIWKIHEENIVKPLLQIGIDKHFTNIECNAEIIHKICGIFDINAFEIRGYDGEVLRGIYPNAALLAHNCIANTLISVDNLYNMKIYATVPIKQGDMIYYNYTNVLLGTDERQKQLSFGKYFKCECKRCQDPTELGTHISSLTCQQCGGVGLVLHIDSDWTCTNCFVKIEDFKVQKLLSDINEEVAEANGDIRYLEMLIMKYTPILNPSHYIIIDLKQNVASILRTICLSSLCKPGAKVLERKIQLCKEIIPVLKLLEPGISRLTGIAIYECFVPFLQLTKDQYNNLEIPKDVYLTKLNEAECMLKEAIGMLCHEHIQTPEGQLAKNALLELADLRTSIKNLTKEEN